MSGNESANSLDTAVQSEAASSWQLLTGIASNSGRQQHPSNEAEGSPGLAAQDDSPVLQQQSGGVVQASQHVQAGNEAVSSQDAGEQVGQSLGQTRRDMLVDSTMPIAAGPSQESQADALIALCCYCQRECANRDMTATLLQYTATASMYFAVSAWHFTVCRSEVLV